MIDVSSDWLVPWHTPEEPAFRLFAVGHAGTGAAPFRAWATAFAPVGGELVALRLPGRERRLREPPLGRLDELANEACDAISHLTSQPFAFFGHCSGALVAHAIVRELRQRGLALPYLLVAAAELGPRAAGEHYHQRMVPTNLRERLVALGGTPPDILENPDLLKLLTPALEADFKVIDSYRYVPDSPLDISIVALEGSDDTVTDPEGIRTWAEESSRPLHVRTVDGDHFFTGDSWLRLGSAVALVAAEQLRAR